MNEAPGKLMTPGKWYTVFDECGNAVEAHYDESYHKLLGYESEDEFADTQESWTSSFHPDDRERIEAYMADVLSKHPEGMDYDAEYRMMTKWGYRWFHDYGHCTRREDGSVMRCDGIAIDIQELKDYELQQNHDTLRKEVLDYIINHEGDPIELLKTFADKIRALMDCDQVVYRDLDNTRIMVNSTSIEKTWSVPESYCRQCPHFDAHHPMYAGGYTEMDNCQDGWQGIPVYHKCPIKSSLTRIVYCNGEVAGYMAIHFVRKYHHFTDLERKTMEDFVNGFSIILSKFESRKKKEAETRVFAENNARILALEDNFESLYDVDLESGGYEVFIKGPAFGNISKRLVNRGSFFSDTYHNVGKVLYKDDRDAVVKALDPDNIRSILAKESHFDTYYRLLVDGSPIWARMRVLYKDSSHKHIIVGVFNAEEDMAIKHQREKDASNKNEIIIGFANKYEASFTCNLLDGSFNVISDRNGIIERVAAKVRYADSIKVFMKKFVYPSDRHFFEEHLLNPSKTRESLKIGETVKFEYRSNAGGDYTWHRANIRRISESEAIVGFEDCNDEMISRIVSSKLIAEYDAIYLVGLTKNEILPAQSSRVSDVGSFSEKKEYDRMVRAFADTVAPEYRSQWISFSDPEYMRLYMAREDHREYMYELPGIQKTLRRFCVDVVERVNGNAETLLFSFIGLDDVSAQNFLMQRKLAEHQKKEKAAEDLISSFTKNFNLVYKVDMADDSFETLRKDERMLGGNIDFHSFSDVVDFFLSNVVYSVDKDMMERELEIGRVRRRLAESSTYVVRYRVFIDGISLWNEMTVSALDDYQIVIGFYAVSQDILMKFLQQKSFGSYNALYTIDLDAELMTSLKSPEGYSMIGTGETGPASELIGRFASQMEGEAREYFQRISNLATLGEMFASDDKVTYSFLSTLTENSVWMSVIMYALSRHADGTPSVVSLGFSFLDKSGSDRQELMAKVAEQGAFTKYFLEPFQSAYYVGLNDLSLQVYKRTDDLDEKYPVTTNYVDSLTEYINSELHPDDRERMLDLIRPENMREMLSKQPEFFYVYRLVSDGKERYMRFQVIRGADEDHAAFGFKDITEEVRLQEENKKQLEDALSMAQSANRAKTTFLNNMSHDIRTPMNAIIGYTGLAASHIDNKDQVRDYLFKISQSSDHLLSLINDVLDMSRIESGKMNLDEKEENISDIIHTLRNIVQADIHSKQLDFFVDAVDVNDENICCDKLRLNQVLLNVLSNAIKYTPAGGTISLRVKETTIKETGYAQYEFRVKDNGMGMDKEFLKTIFEPFTRVKSSTVSGIQGTGLGMAITRNIVDMMGGTIEIYSEPGKGTEVVIAFDFKLASAPVAPVAIPEYIGLRGLVVDDDTNTCLSVYAMLKDVGMRAEWCTSGKEAVIRAGAAFHEGDLFRVFIIDWLMPDMNGVETARRIRKEIGNDVPIIILTAYDWSDIEDEAKEAGVTAFVSKPMFPSDLHRALSKCLGNETVQEVDQEEEFNISGKKILLAEDNALNSEIATAVLEEYGCIVYPAEDGDIAVDMIRNASVGDYDLVLMDIQMPTIDGYEAARQIRALGSEVSKIPIIAMTANAFEEDRKAALEAGMDEHIAKPIDIAKLKETLSKFL